MELSDFHTRASANEGKRMELTLPDGAETAEWLVILGVDSDAFRNAEDSELRRAIDEGVIEDDATRRARSLDGRRRIVASLIGNWSFDTELTPESAFEFLKEAPQIQRQIDSLATRRALFFKPKAKI